MSANYYLRLDGIQGGCKVPGHIGEIELMSYNWGTNGRNTVGMGAGTQRSDIHDLSFIKTQDQITSTLIHYCATGKHISNGTLSVVEVLPNKQSKPYMTIDFTDIFVSSVRPSGDRGGYEKPSEEVSINFSTYKRKV